MKGLKQEYWSGVTRGEVSVERRRMLSVECSRTVVKKETLAVSITVPIVACSKSADTDWFQRRVFVERKAHKACKKYPQRKMYGTVVCSMASSRILQLPV